MIEQVYTTFIQEKKLSEFNINSLGYLYLAFFRMDPEKLAICDKRGRFRGKGHFIKVVASAILKTFSHGILKEKKT